MTFRVNGLDIFCKGANWIPQDALPQRESRARWSTCSPAPRPPT